VRPAGAARSPIFFFTFAIGDRGGGHRRRRARRSIRRPGPRQHPQIDARPLAAALRVDRPLVGMPVTRGDSNTVPCYLVDSALKLFATVKLTVSDSRRLGHVK
jgi:hypothetical protein